uniref:Uncharacterized protein n=1 Tax=Cannabis sativa TaxID=3483 RepID=A0A803PKL4_CANSA
MVSELCHLKLWKLNSSPPMEVRQPLHHRQQQIQEVFLDKATKELEITKNEANLAHAKSTMGRGFGKSPSHFSHNSFGSNQNQQRTGSDSYYNTSNGPPGFPPYPGMGGTSPGRGQFAATTTKTSTFYTV